MKLPDAAAFDVADNDFVEKIRSYFGNLRYTPCLAATVCPLPNVWQKRKSRGALRFVWEQNKGKPQGRSRPVRVSLEPGQGCEVQLHAPNSASLLDLFEAIFKHPVSPDVATLLKSYAAYIADARALAPLTVEFLRLVDDGATLADVPFWTLLFEEPPTFERVAQSSYLRESARVGKTLATEPSPVKKSIAKKPAKRAAEVVVIAEPKPRTRVDTDVLESESDDAIH